VSFGIGARTGYRCYDWFYKKHKRSNLTCARLDSLSAPTFLQRLAAFAPMIAKSSALKRENAEPSRDRTGGPVKNGRERSVYTTAVVVDNYATHDRGFRKTSGVENAPPARTILNYRGKKRSRPPDPRNKPPTVLKIKRGRRTFGIVVILGQQLSGSVVAAYSRGDEISGMYLSDDSPPKID